jgi:hypothetical protein
MAFSHGQHSRHVNTAIRIRFRRLSIGSGASRSSEPRDFHRRCISLQLASHSKLQGARNPAHGSLLFPRVMNGTGTCRQFIPKAARPSSRAAFVFGPRGTQ